MTRFQKAFCVLLCIGMLGAVWSVVAGCFLAPFDTWENAGGLFRLVPLCAWCRDLEAEEEILEDSWTCAQVIENNQAYLTRQVLGENDEAAKEEEASKQQEEEKRQEEQKQKEKEAAAPAATPNPAIDLSAEALADYSYLMQNFFILDPNTATNEQQLNAASLLGADMTLKEGEGPQILIYHSHSQEEFADSVPGEVETTVVGVGNYLAQLLEETYGYEVLHITDQFDVIDGQIDRNRAYDFAREKVEQVLEENPSIQVIIDLHRDGVAEDRRLVTEINGKQTAQIMCFNGLSYTVNNGTVDYLPNPYIQENLAFSFQLEMQGKLYYPDFFRGIYLAGLRYNLHLRPRAILLEAGAQTNTVEEVKNAMEPFAFLLDRVLTGESRK